MTERNKPSQSLELEKEMDKRKLYLEAMAVSLGASEINIPVIINGIFDSKDSLEKIYNQQSSIKKISQDERYEMNDKIRSLGELFISESKYKDQLDKHNIGTWVLRLLFDSESVFSCFPGKIYRWADEFAGIKFERYIEKHSSDCKTT